MFLTISEHVKILMCSGMEVLDLLFGEGCDLDSLFGQVRIAENGGKHRQAWEEGRSPASICNLDADSGLALATLGDSGAALPVTEFVKSVIFIWAMTPAGEIKIAVEEVAMINSFQVEPGYSTRRKLDKKLTLDRKLGHPCLTLDDSARIAGEFYFDKSREPTLTGGDYVWTINASSGRFHLTPDRWPTRSQLRNVGEIFSKWLGRVVLIESDDDLVPVR